MNFLKQLAAVFKFLKEAMLNYFTYIMIAIGTIIIGSISGLIVSGIQHSNRVQTRIIQAQQLAAVVVPEETNFNLTRSFDDVPDSQYYSTYNIAFKINDNDYTIPLEMGYTLNVNNLGVTESRIALGNGDVWTTGRTSFSIILNSRTITGSILLENSSIGDSFSRFDVSIGIDSNPGNIYTLNSITVERANSSELKDQIGTYRAITFAAPQYGIDYSTLRTLVFNDSSGEILSVSKQELEASRSNRLEFRVTKALSSVARNNLELAIELVLNDTTNALTIISTSVLRTNENSGNIQGNITISAVQRAYAQTTQDVVGEDNVLENFYETYSVAYSLNGDGVMRTTDVRLGRLVDDTKTIDQYIDDRGVTWSIGERVFQINNVNNNSGQAKNIVLRVIVRNETASGMTSTIRTSIEILNEINSNWEISIANITANATSWQRKPVVLKEETFTAVNIGYPDFYDLDIYNGTELIAELSKVEIQNQIDSGGRTTSITKQMIGSFENGDILINLGLNSDDSMLTISRLTIKLNKIGERIPDSAQAFTITIRTNVKQEIANVEETVSAENIAKYFQKFSVSYNVNGTPFTTEIEATKSINYIGTASVTTNSLNSLITEGSSYSEITIPLASGNKNIIAFVETTNNTVGDLTTLTYEVKTTLYDVEGTQYTIDNIAITTDDQNLVDKPTPSA